MINPLIVCPITTNVSLSKNEADALHRPWRFDIHLGEPIDSG